MANFRMISGDNHVVEPPDLWVTRIESKYRDRCPYAKRQENEDWWYCDGHIVYTGYGFGGSQTGERFKEGAGANLNLHDVFENVKPGGYIPEEHVKDMDIDGVDVSISYPTIGVQMFKEPDTELLNAIFRAYNNWLADFCSYNPKRLKGIAMINIDDVQEGVRELERSRKLGFIGGMITVRPPIGRRYDSPEYEPLWAAAQDLDIPLGLHLDTNRLGSGDGDGAGPDGFAGIQRNINNDHYVRMSLAEMILSGVFVRHPKLQIGAVEFESGWAPYFLNRLDYGYSDRLHEFFGRIDSDMLPSDFFHRNVFVGFQEDPQGITLRNLIGVDNLMWGSDYPHHESTFPKSREILEKILVDCTEEEKAKIAGGNAARVYRLD
jgi:predicted TIM-barrel fold metal-dependent hydrolase